MSDGVGDGAGEDDDEAHGPGDPDGAGEPDGAVDAGGVAIGVAVADGCWPGAWSAGRPAESGSSALPITAGFPSPWPEASGDGDTVAPDVCADWLGVGEVESAGEPDDGDGEGDGDTDGDGLGEPLGETLGLGDGDVPGGIVPGLQLADADGSGTGPPPGYEVFGLVGDWLLCTGVGVMLWEFPLLEITCGSAATAQVAAAITKTPLVSAATGRSQPIQPGRPSSGRNRRTRPLPARRSAAPGCASQPRAVRGACGWRATIFA